MSNSDKEDLPGMKMVYGSVGLGWVGFVQKQAKIEGFGSNLFSFDQIPQIRQKWDILCAGVWRFTSILFYIWL